MPCGKLLGAFPKRALLQKFFRQGNEETFSAENDLTKKAAAKSAAAGAGQNVPLFYDCRVGCFLRTR